MTPLATIFLLLGIFLASRVLAEALRVGAFGVRLTKQPPPTVRIALQERADVIVFHAIKGHRK